MTNVLLAGCGDVATLLGRRLIEKGHRVWGLRRNVAHLPPGFERIAADLTDPDALAGLPGVFEHVVYSASAGGASDDAYRLAYVDGLKNLIAALRTSPVRRLFFVSSTAVYAQTDGSWVDESSETEPTTFPGLRSLQAESVAREAPFPSTVLRCSGIYGPGREQLVDRVRSGAARASRRYGNRIHRHDVAGAIEHLMSRDAAEPLLLLSDDEPAPLCDVVSFLARRLGVPEPPPASADAPAPTRGGNKRCRNAALRRTGYALRYPSYREGYAALLEGRSNS